jgi:hypothetical protein
MLGLAFSQLLGDGALNFLWFDPSEQILDYLGATSGFGTSEKHKAPVY